MQDSLKRIDSSDLSDDGFKAAVFEQVAFIRAFEAKALALTQLTPPLIQGSVHLCAGQEVVPVASVSALREDDQIICTYRGHGWALASGMGKTAVFGELCHKADGLNGGRGGSAYMMAPETRFFGENSIVGAGTTIACGVALANVRRENGSVVVVSIGDGALNQGAVHEAMAFAAARSLPVIFVVENNGWSELTPSADMFRVDRLAKRASGYGFPSATMDGTDPIAVRDSVSLAAARARSGDGPSLLEFRVPRLWGHYHRDPEHYRSKENKRADEERDPLRRLRVELANGADDQRLEDELARAEAEVEALAATVLEWATPTPGDALNEVVARPAEGASLAVIETREMTYIQAVNTALREILETTPEALVFGEDVGKPGGIFQASRYLQRDFGEGRVFDTPIAENAILGSAVGAAMSGMRPIAEIMWADFTFVALDQLVNQAANIRYITGGKTTVPMVVRTQQGVTPGSCAQHSRSIEALLCHIPGLKVAIAATGNDAYSLLKSAAADEDPCIVIEARGLYPTRDQVSLTAGAEPIGKARFHAKGDDAVIVTWGTMLGPCIAAASSLAGQGIHVAVLDLRWLSPIDENALDAGVAEAGGRVIIVHEAARTGGFAAELIVQLQERFEGGLEIIARRVTGPDVPMPASPVLQSSLLPDPPRIERAVIDVLSSAGRAAHSLSAYKDEGSPIFDGVPQRAG